MSHIIVGLGNPGEEYADTRHNTGRIVVEHIAKAHDFEEFSFDKKINAHTSKGKIEKESVTLVLPDTFMNKSGSSLKTLVTSVKKAEKLVVVYDDFHLPLGTLKISFNRSSGGHNGLESIIKAVKTEAFIRVRVGVAPSTASGKVKVPHGEKEVENFILGAFKKPEVDILKKVSKKATEAVEMILVEGKDKAMSVFNQG